MASAFVVGDKFRNKVTELLKNTDSSVPETLRDELEKLLEKSGPTILSFSAARQLKKYLQVEGKNNKTTLFMLCDSICWTVY